MRRVWVLSIVAVLGLGSSSWRPSVAELHMVYAEDFLLNLSYVNYPHLVDFAEAKRGDFFGDENPDYPAEGQPSALRKLDHRFRAVESDATAPFALWGVVDGAGTPTPNGVTTLMGVYVGQSGWHYYPHPTHAFEPAGPFTFFHTIDTASGVQGIQVRLEGTDPAAMTVALDVQEYHDGALETRTYTAAIAYEDYNYVDAWVEWRGASGVAAAEDGPSASDGSVRLWYAGSLTPTIEVLNIPLVVGDHNKITHVRFDGMMKVHYGPWGMFYSTDWVDIPNFHAHEWLNASEYPGGAARVLCDLWTTAAGVTMKARLVSLLADDTTIDAVVGTSAEVTATVPTDASFDVVLAGLKQHKLQVTSNPTDTDLWCAPGAKVLP